MVPTGGKLRLTSYPKGKYKERNRGTRGRGGGDPRKGATTKGRFDTTTCSDSNCEKKGNL